MDDRDIEDNNDDHVQIMTNGAMVSFLKRVISLIQNIENTDVVEISGFISNEKSWATKY